MKTDYNIGPKKSWRQWVWARIEERLNVPAKDATCVYLAGTENLDLKYALAKGFREQNMFPVEYKRSEILKLRANKVSCVYGDFFSAVVGLAKSRRVDVVYGDFMCNLNPGAFIECFNLIGTLMDQPSPIYIYNFLRGRERWRGDLLNVYQSMMKNKQYCYRTVGTVNAQDWPKHRGLMFILLSLIRMLGKVKIELDDHTRCLIERDYISAARAVFYSYKSYLKKNVQVFDTIVFNRPAHGLARIADQIEPKLCSLGSETYFVSTKTIQSLNAIRAIRTMKQQGTI